MDFPCLSASRNLVLLTPLGKAGSWMRKILEWCFEARESFPRVVFGEAPSRSNTISPNSPRILSISEGFQRFSPVKWIYEIRKVKEFHIKTEGKMYHWGVSSRRSPPDLLHRLALILYHFRKCFGRFLDGVATLPRSSSTRFWNIPSYPALSSATKRIPAPAF